MRRLPDRVLGDRVRTSTLLLALAFLVVLTIYVVVRPLPGAYVDHDGRVVVPAPSRSTHAPATTRGPEPSPTAATPTSPAAPTTVPTTAPETAPETAPTPAPTPQPSTSTGPAPASAGPRPSPTTPSATGPPPSPGP